MNKMLISTLAVATLAVSLALPAQARSRAHTAYYYGGDAYAQYLGPRYDRVYFGNEVVGADPDINVRAQIMRDPIPEEY